MSRAVTALCVLTSIAAVALVSCIQQPADVPASDEVTHAGSVEDGHVR